MPQITWEQVENFGPDEWDRAILALKELTDVASLVKPVDKFPWFGTKPGLVLPGDEKEILHDLQECLTALQATANKLESTADEIGLRKLFTPNAIAQLLLVGRFIATGPKVENHVLRNSEWDRPNESAKAMIAKVTEYQSKTSIVLDQFKVDALEEDVGRLLVEYDNGLKNHLRIFIPRWWKLLWKIRSLFKTSAPWKSVNLVAHLTRLAEVIEIRSEVRKHNDEAKLLFGSLWIQEKSQTPTLSKFAEWIVQFRSYVRQGVILDKALKIVSNPPDQKIHENSLDELAKLEEDFITKRNKIFARLNINAGAIFGLEPDYLEGDRLAERLILLQKSMNGLQRWSQYVIYREKVRGTDRQSAHCSSRKWRD